MYASGNGSEYVLALTTGKNEGYTHIGTITGNSLCLLNTQGTVFCTLTRAALPCTVSSGELADPRLFRMYGNGTLATKLRTRIQSLGRMWGKKRTKSHSVSL